MSDFNENLRNLLQELTVINDLSKEAKDEISEFFKKEDSSDAAREDITEKLLHITSSLHDKTAKTKSSYSKLSNHPDANQENSEVPTNVTENSTEKDDSNKADEGSVIKEENKENEIEPVKKPMLKIVDFSKLVDPRNLELMDKNHRNKQIFKDTSVIILSSSEDENVTGPASNTSNLKKPELQKSKSGNLQANKIVLSTLKTAVKNKISVCKPPKSKREYINKNKGNVGKRTRLNDKLEEQECLKTIINSDIRFRSKPYVNLLRVPCEELKSFYLKKGSQIKKKSRQGILDEKTGELLKTSSSSDEDEPIKRRNIKNKKCEESKSTKLEKLSKTSKPTEKHSKNTKEDDTLNNSSDAPLKEKTLESKKAADLDEESENKSDSASEQNRHNENNSRVENKSDDEKVLSDKVEEEKHSRNRVLRKKHSERVPETKNSDENSSSDEEITNSHSKKQRKTQSKSNRNRKGTSKKNDRNLDASDEELKSKKIDYKSKENSSDEGTSKRESRKEGKTGSKRIKNGKRILDTKGSNIDSSDVDSINSKTDKADKKSENKQIEAKDINKTKNNSKEKDSANETGLLADKENKDTSEENIDEKKQQAKNKKSKENKKLSDTEDDAVEGEISSEKKDNGKSATDEVDSQISKKTQKGKSKKETDEKVDSLSDEENVSVIKKKKNNKVKNVKDKKGASDSSEEEDQNELPTKNNAQQNLSDEDTFNDNENKSKDEDSSDKETEKASKRTDENVEKTNALNSSDVIHSLSSSDDDIPPPKKKNQDSSDSDVKEKKRRRKSSDAEVSGSHDSDDSDDVMFSRKKTRKLKKVAKTLASDSDGENETRKSDKSGSESDGNKNDDSESEKEEKKDSKKRRRIQNVNDDSSGSENAKSTRKKIKRLISKSSLSDLTLKAEAEEKERKQRIVEKQKKYNQLYESSDLASSAVEKLVLDIDEKTDEPLLEVSKSLVSKLKPHQASGIQFMWDACFESLKRAKSSDGSGCILAHCMGLGKTLQVITLTNTLLEAAETTRVRKVLIVTPLSTVLNWKAEYSNWLSGDEDYEVYELVSGKAQNAERSFYIKQWHENGGVLIMSYSMFRNLSNDKNKKISKKFRNIFVEGLVDPGPDLVVCDEGHLLKNEKTSLSIAMNKIKTRRRIVLTGTPLQNNLKEYYCMVQFVKPNLLGTYREYLNRFVNPITNGQYTDSTQYDINIMRRRSHVLHKLLDGIVQRRDYSVLSPYLPPKFEYVVFLTLTETQNKLYSHYMTNFARKSKDGSNRTASYLFQDFQAFARICIHPRVLLDKSNEDQQKYQTDDEESEGSLKDFVVHSESETTTDSDSSKSGSESGSTKKSKSRSKRVTRAQAAAKESNSESEEEEVVVQKEWWQEYCDGDELDNLAHGTKLLILFEILKECEQIGDKVLVFSQSLYALNCIEYFLGKVDEATQNGNTKEKTLGYSGSWSPGLDYFRLDGSTNCSLRSDWCDSFNKESNTRARLFLLSTRAGGLGINLVAANRVIIFDVSWNPSSDLQSIYRVYRFGQLKPTYIYRFVIYGAMEMKVYERQVTKQAISKRVIDEQQIDRHYNQNDLNALYNFEQPNIEDRPIPLVPKDVLLGELLQHHEDKIFKYHEHQSLLENKEDETLNEEERKAAWEEFESEKTDRTKQQNLIGRFSVNTVQLALKSIIQRDNPTWNQSQILSIIPQLIQQLNVQLGSGDKTMYNRIAGEVKLMQEEYNRKMQMQYQQYRLKIEAQRQQQLGYLGAPNPFAAQFQHFMGMGNMNPMGNMAAMRNMGSLGNMGPMGNLGVMSNMGNMGASTSMSGPSSLNPSEIVELN